MLKCQINFNDYSKDLLSHSIAPDPGARYSLQAKDLMFLHLLFSTIITSSKLKISDAVCEKSNLKAKVDEASLKLREDVTRSCWIYHLHHSFSYHNPS